MACKSAMIDAVIRTAGLTGIFIKTHRHTLKNNLPDIGNRPDDLPFNGNCNSTLPEDKPITPKQKDLIEKIAGRRGLTTEGLNKAVHRLFEKDFDSLDRVQASRFIQHLNG